MEDSFRLVMSNKEQPIKQEYARWFIERIGKNIPAGTAGLEIKKRHSDIEEAEQSGRAEELKDRMKQRCCRKSWLIFTTIKIELIRWLLLFVSLFFQAKNAFCTLCLLFSLNYACFQLNHMQVWKLLVLLESFATHCPGYTMVIASAVPSMKFLEEQRHRQKKIECLTPSLEVFAHIN